MKQEIRKQKTISELLEMWRSVHNCRLSEGKCKCDVCKALVSHAHTQQRKRTHNRCEDCARIVEDYAIAEYQRSRRANSPFTHPDDVGDLLRKKIRRVFRYDYGIRLTPTAHDRIVMFHPEGAHNESRSTRANKAS